MEDKEKTEEIKVLDRRRFSPSGEERAGEAGGERDKSLASESPPQVDGEQNFVEVDFPSFIISLATQAMMFLGEVPEELRQERTNIPAAKQTIDIIAMLEQKTTGNLNDQEKRLVSDVLTSLRMSFVKASQKN